MKSSAVLVVAGVASMLLRKQSGATRHLLWTAAFAAILLVPVLSAVLPAMRISIASKVLPEVLVRDIATASPANAFAQREATHIRRSDVQPVHTAPDLRMWLMLLWAAGSVVAFARLALAYAAAMRLRRGAQAVFAGSKTEVLLTEHGSMPMAVGIWRPAILMPEESSEWPEEQRHMVWLHELAHIRRGDAVTHLLAHLAMAVYWWNPLAWFAWREFLKERERAADDLVLQSGAQASVYAGLLLQVARRMQTPALAGWAAATMGRSSQLEGRVTAILDPGADRTAPRRATVMATVLIATAAIVPLAALHAQEAQIGAVPTDIGAAIRVARSQRNYEPLDTSARAAIQSGQYDAAQELLQAALSIRAETAGENSVEYGVGLLELGEVDQKKNPKTDGQLYARAALVLGEHPEAAPALSRLGILALSNKQYEQAFGYFQHAQAVDPAHAATATMWMAVTRQREQNMAEADLLYQRALAVEDTNHEESPVLMLVYAHFLREQGRTDDAGQFESRAIAMRKADAKPVALPAGVYRIGKGVTPPSIDHKKEPEFSEEARLAWLQGTVVLQIVVGTDGSTKDLQIVRGLGLGLDEQALEAVKQWKFKPAMQDGQPVPVTATIEVNFRLL